MQSPFPRRDGSGRVTRARASYTLGLAAICACSPWPWGHVAPSGTMWSGAPVGKRAALRRAWRGVGRGARGRGGAGRRVGRGGGAVWGGVDPLRVAAQTRADTGRRHFSDLPTSRPEKCRRPVFYLARSREPVAWPPLSLLTCCGSQRLRALGSVHPPHPEPKIQYKICMVKSHTKMHLSNKT